VAKLLREVRGGSPWLRGALSRGRPRCRSRRCRSAPRPGCSKARHGAHVATDEIHEPGAHVGPGLADGQAPPPGGTPERGIRGDGEVGLGDADRERAEPGPLVHVELGWPPPVGSPPRRPVDLGRHPLDLLPQRRLVVVEHVELPWLRGGLDDCLGQLDRTLSALLEVRAHRSPRPGRCSDLADGSVLRREVTRHGVDGDDGRHAVTPHDGKVGQEIGRAELHLLGVSPALLAATGARPRRGGVPNAASSALTVVTTTAASGTRPDVRHLM